MQPASHALSRAEGRASLNLHFALRTSPRSSFSLSLHLFIKKGQSPGRLEGTETLHRLSTAGFPLFLSPVGPGLEVLPLFLVRPSLAFHLISSRLSSPPFQPTLNPPKAPCTSRLCAQVFAPRSLPFCVAHFSHLLPATCARNHVTVILVMRAALVLMNPTHETPLANLTLTLQPAACHLRPS